MGLRIVIAVAVLLPIFAHLGYAIVNSPITGYYVTVDEYGARSAKAPVRVGGQIVPGSIQWDNSTQTMRFQIAGTREKMEIVHKGVVPDSFREGVTAILEGQRSNSSTFSATNILIKCPHQYLPAG